MVANFPGPYQIDILYTVDTFEHVMKLNFDSNSSFVVGGPTGGYTMKTRAGADVNLETAVDAFTDLMAARLDANESVIVGYDIWSVAPLSFDRTYIGTVALNKDGTSLVPFKKAMCEIYSFRTTEGGVMKLYILETSAVDGVPLPYPTALPTLDAIFAFIASDSNWILARDTSYPIQARRFLPGTNEAVFRKRFRS